MRLHPAGPVRRWAALLLAACWLPGLPPSAAVWASQNARTPQAAQADRRSDAVQVEFRRGDAIETTRQAPFYVRGELFREVPAGTRMTVLEVRGEWVGVRVRIAGEERLGWVWIQRVQRVAAGASSTPPALDNPAELRRFDDPEALAALRRLGLGTDTDADGLVILVDAAGAEITDDDVARLVGLPRLQTLYLDEGPVTDAALAHIGRMASLESLSLAGCPITDKGAAHLQALSELRVLNLSNTRVSDAGLKHLAPLERLETLALADTPVTGSGFQHFAKLRNLITLNIQNAPVTDDRLLYLAGLPKLRIIHAQGTRITDAGEAEMHREISGLAIYR